MLSGVKIIPRDKVQDENGGGKRKKSVGDSDKRKSKKNDDSSSDDGMEKIRKGSRRKKKWYSSDEFSELDSSGSESESEDISKYHKHEKRRDKNGTKNRSKKESRKATKRTKKEISPGKSSHGRVSPSPADGEVVRREMGLEWMLRPGQKMNTDNPLIIENKEETPVEEVKKANPKEMNPYLKDDGIGYPEETSEKNNQLLSTSLVGDGGASWRLKALKRAKEQAAREGKKLEEVVEERWGSLGTLAVSAASQTAAPSRAHLHAIRSRRNVPDEEDKTGLENKRERHSEKGNGRDYLRDVSIRRPEMRAPKTDASLSWGKRKSHTRVNEDVGLISEAASSLNKFSNDGNFMQELLIKQKKEAVVSAGSHMKAEGVVEQKAVSREIDSEGPVRVDGLSANQLAAKALQLRMKGKHEEAEKLQKEAEKMKAKQVVGDNSLSKNQDIRTTTRYAIKDLSARRRGDDDDTDKHLARTIMQNKKFSVSGQADDEYDDYGDAPSRKSRKKGSSNEGQNKISESDSRVKRMLTQQERCIFCFENPTRPKHLVVSIANFTYLMLPQYQSVVPGHCCIVPMQHEAATRSVDDSVWEEIRNFKKCLIMMFAKQEKEVVFLETVIGLSQQRRHCLIECIPLPREIANDAPLYFKKAIDEAEDEWSQHNAKKLIDTTVKGLRNSIPKNFPYFHVEFGLSKGFVHVIDDEKQFNSSLGLNVIRGMLQLAEEDMCRRRRHESVESQKQAVASFAREWEPFDWTKQLD